LCVCVLALCLQGAEGVAKLPATETPTFAELSDLRGRSRHIAVITTASLPWMTGTAVNPLLRAVYLEKRREHHEVSLVIPWVSTEDQKKIFGGTVFQEQAVQASWVRSWVKKYLGYSTHIRILFYHGAYMPEFGSIFPTGDVTASIPEGERDVAILEEPEHLTWTHLGDKWCEAFNFVVGVVHTNYINYALNDHQTVLPLRPVRAAILATLNDWCCRAYCHRVIKLSDAVPSFPNSITCNIHGVRSNFIEIGVTKIRSSIFGYPRFSKGLYFIGKALWSKGYRQLFHNLKEYRRMKGANLEVDVYGSGPDEMLIKDEVQKEGLAWTFCGPVDHASPAIHDYKVMINPSLSDVVCTTTAEALAMGKFVVCADHPSNEFFKTFRNCFVYSTMKEFVLCLNHALAADPAPLTDNDRYRLSWEAATERLYDSVYSGSRRKRKHAVDRILADVHCKLASWRLLRDWVPLGPDAARREGAGATEETLLLRVKRDLLAVSMLSFSFLTVAALALSNSLTDSSESNGNPAAPAPRTLPRAPRGAATVPTLAPRQPLALFPSQSA